MSAETYRRRFWEQVTVRDARECWDWNGPVTDGGHGKWKGQLAHRLAVWFSGIHINARLDVHHTCNNKLCVSPFHMQVLKHSDHSRLTRIEHTKENNGNQ